MFQILRGNSQEIVNFGNNPEKSNTMSLQSRNTHKNDYGKYETFL